MHLADVLERSSFIRIAVSLTRAFGFKTQRSKNQNRGPELLKGCGNTTHPVPAVTQGFLCTEAVAPTDARNKSYKVGTYSGAGSINQGASRFPSLSLDYLWSNSARKPITVSYIHPTRSQGYNCSILFWSTSRNRFQFLKAFSS